MTRNTTVSKRYGLFVTLTIPMEAMPIPFSITDFGRAYLAAEETREAREAQGDVVRTNNGTPLQRQAARRLRSQRMR